MVLTHTLRNEKSDDDDDVDDDGGGGGGGDGDAVVEASILQFIHV